MKSMTKLMVIAMLLVAALVVAPAVAAPRANPVLNTGGSIYVGEENLNLTALFQDNSLVANGTLVFAPTESNQKTIPVDSVHDFDVLSADVGSATGIWYAYNNTADIKPLGAGAAGSVQIRTPSTSLDVLLAGTTTSVNGQSVTRGQSVDFRISHNLAGIPGALMDIRVTTPGGGTVTQINGISLADRELTGQRNTTSNVPMGNLTTGTYTARGVFDEPDVTGTGFDTDTVTFEVTTGALSLVSNKDNVVRGNTFTVTITGESETLYNVSVSGTGINRPMIVAGQVGVTNNTGFDASAKTTAAGTRSVEFNTSSDAATRTEARTYTIEVKTLSGDKSDDVKVRVEAGSVSVTASGTGTYFVGEELTLSGTNTDSGTTYLFMTGPNLNSNGVNLTARGSVGDNTAGSFTRVEVEADDTWSYKWTTSDLGTIDSGGYTIYAVSSPQGRNNLTDAEYDTQTIQLRPGFITATMSSATIAKGDDVTITGTAQGNPEDVRIWVFGKNFYGAKGALDTWTVDVESDGTFEFDDLDTSELVGGQYFVVVQHPMGPDYEVAPGSPTFVPPQDTDSIFRANQNGVRDVFVAKLTNLQAAEAANALIDALESAYVNDAYTKLTFFLEDAWIRIDPIGDQSAGSTFTISGTTNLAAGEDVVVEVTSASFQPGQTGQTTGFSSDAGTVTIQAGETANTWSFEVDGSSFRPDQYIVSVESIEASTSTTGTFNVIEGPATTQPTGTVTTTPTGTETTPTTTTTTQATPTTTPGFGALLALAGLGAVAFLVLRRD
ncbi:hypothetical protein DSECCO2_601050 [anaerobic digester metagenome]